LKLAVVVGDISLLHLTVPHNIIWSVTMWCTFPDYHVYILARNSCVDRDSKFEAEFSVSRLFSSHCQLIQSLCLAMLLPKPSLAVIMQYKRRKSTKFSAEGNTL
jgi:hypothetical protein